MALVIAIAQSKGGAGKTSLTVHLACALGGRRVDEGDMRKRVGLVDLDPLESLTKWFHLRESRLGPDARLSIYTGIGWRAQGEIDRAKPPNPLAGASYQTSDRRWLLLAFVETEKNWPVFAKAIDRPDLLTDERFKDGIGRRLNAAAFVAELDRVFATQALEYWKKRLDEARLPYGVVQVPEEIVKDPQLLANDIIVPLAGAGEKLTSTISSPIQVHGITKVPAKRAPRIGEHNDEVLKEFAFTTNDIEGLRLALGFWDSNPVVDADRTQHAGTIRIGDAARDRWAMAPGLAAPEQILATINHLARHSVEVGA